MVEGSKKWTPATDGGAPAESHDAFPYISHNYLICSFEVHIILHGFGKHMTPTQVSLPYIFFIHVGHFMPWNDKIANKM